ncbi:MAG: gamma-glutamylcyclotransferase family protein [Candidatus Latescibacterota bacterium]|nr:gamma-glutamylcyclotransferase family protein [Candidatus Latescibacterota bacterium]
MLYFAYGSNLHPLRLSERIGACKQVRSGLLRGHRLRFHKVSVDDSGKCNLAADGDAVAYGAIYRMTAEQLKVLDEFEGEGYERVTVEVIQIDGSARTCQTYFADAGYVDDNQVPYDWYKELVVLGARHCRFPEHYQLELQSHPAVPDPHLDRAEKNWKRVERLRTWTPP